MKKLFVLFLIMFVSPSLADLVSDFTGKCDDYDNAFAVFEPDKYSCPDGEFLPASYTTCEPCSNGYTCDGGTFTYDDNKYSGLTQTSTYHSDDETHTCSSNFGDNIFAAFQPNTYTCAKGEFLPASYTTCEPCSNGYTCDGGTFTYDDNKYSGLTPTSTYHSDDETNTCSSNFGDNIFAVFRPNTYDCNSGYYLPAGATSCAACPRGYTCTGGTLTYDDNNDSGIVINTYNCASGKYLPADSLSCAVCPRGYTCAGGTYDYDADNDQGIVINTYDCAEGEFLPANGLECAECPINGECEGGSFDFNPTTAQGLVMNYPVTEDIKNACEEKSYIYSPTFAINQYNCASGKYLPADSLGCESCLRGHTCAGGIYDYNATNDQGIVINTYTCSSGYFLPANGLGCVACPTDATCSGGTFTFNPTTAQGININYPVTHNLTNSCEEKSYIYSPTFTINSYTCASGEYLPSDSLGCESCLRGHTCTAGTYTYNATNDQGIVINSYTCAAGEYLPAEGLACESCLRGHTCAGGTFNYDEDDDQGIAVNSYTCSSGEYLPANAIACETCPTGHTCSGGTFNFNAKDFQGLVLDTDASIPANTNVCAENFPASLKATYDINTYTCSSGQYLPADGVACESCPTGYACPGGTFTFNPTSDQGKHKFTLNTTTLSANDSLNFTISASGTFTVDCGDGGVLTDNAATTTVSGNTITKSDTTSVTYTCTWTDAGVHKIRFDGAGTGYGTTNSSSAIRFWVGADDHAKDTNAAKVRAIDGSLSSLFPATGTADGQIPNFYYTFNRASLSTLPANLFSGYTTGTNGMFSGTFRYCTSLTALPSGLFSSFTSSAYNMFGGTFEGCSALQSVPATLFSGLTHGAEFLFNATFRGCTSLTSLPAGLFANFTTGANYMFYDTFRGCSNLTGYIPSDFFGGLIANNVSYATLMMDNIFLYTNLATSCDSYNGTERYYTPYDSYWNSKVSCAPANTGYYVTYACGTGSGTAPTDSKQYANGYNVTTVAGADNTCTAPSNSIFTGWSCGGNTVNAGSTFNIGANTTCTAQYAKFAVTTTNLSANATFDFNISASGTFTVDCGDGGTLTSSADPSDVSGYTITRSNTTETTYTCTYSTGGEKTISFDGTATGYNSEIVAAIRYNISDNDNDTNAQKIASISGNLSTIFPALSNNRNPKFYRTFHGAQNLTSIPSTLFNGYTAGSSRLFDSTFRRSGVTSIPPNLFANITTGGAGMFDSTFLGCTGLTEIPSGLFTNITTGVWNMFQSTFHSCTNLQTIPANLFAGITNSAQRMFIYTFYSCSSLREIPATLFSNITTGAEGLFWSTFAYTNLTSIPANLFSNITTGAENMFNSTFSQCPLLSGYVPPTLFAGLITNNVEYATNMMNSIFYNTNLATSCDSYTGTTRYYTPYDSYWSSKVMCGAPITCDAGKYLTANATTCTTCPVNNYCTGGGYGFNYSSDQGITHCSGDLRAPQGMWESQQCGRRFNVGGKYVYSRSTRKTSPSINLDMDLNGTTEFYISLSKIPVPMNVDFENLSQHNKLVIDLPKAYVNSVGVNVPAGKYYAYDDTMVPYTPVEYIESDGTTRIDTGVHGDNNNLSIVTEFMILQRPSSGYNSIFANWVFTNNNAWELVLDSGYTCYTTANTDDVLSTPLGCHDLNSKYTFELDYNGYTLNNVRHSHDSRVRPGTTNDATIRISGGHSNGLRSRIYSFKIYDNNVLIRDLVPAKDENGVVCMYDKVTRKLFYNSGSGTYIAGPDL